MLHVRFATTKEVHPHSLKRGKIFPVFACSGNKNGYLPCAIACMLQLKKSAVSISSLSQSGEDQHAVCTITIKIALKCSDFNDITVSIKKAEYIAVCVAQTVMND